MRRATDRKPAGPMLHIGYPKCASTFLQKRLFPSIPGWTYFDRALPEPEAFLRRLRFEDFSKMESESLAAARSAWRGDVIFSREHVLSKWALGETQGLLNLAYLAEHFDAEPAILVVIRRQDEWVYSEFKFKHTRYRQPDNVINYVGAKFLDYDALDALLRKQVGFSNITYYPYEKFTARPDGFQQFASDVFGTVPDRRLDVTSRVNKSPRQAILGYQFKAVQFLNHRLPAVGRLLPKKNITIPRKKRSEILRRYRSSNAVFSKRNNLDLDRYGYF